TCGQKPEWLDETNPKLNLVHHRDYIPAEFLPTFNSNVIELHLHRIPGLAEHFVSFNDDCYVISPLPRERFFAAEGLPCDIATLKPNLETSQWARSIRHNIELINRQFDKRQVMRDHADKWFDPSYGGLAFWNRLLKPCPRFVALRMPHNAQPYTKTTLERVWAAEEAELNRASANRFRAQNDLTHELFRAWQICEGRFAPYNTYTDTRFFPLVMKPRQAIEAVREQKFRLVCLNDNVHIRNYAQVMAQLEKAFESILPAKSSFEK
ncbi:MAG: stealth conserved region 3 domain-containing protein, partial [Alistipes sp.]|nr:stealth conserved region 3 domain-containing protein [Alistipes sp.]